MSISFVWIGRGLCYSFIGFGGGMLRGPGPIFGLYKVIQKKVPQIYFSERLGTVQGVMSIESTNVEAFCGSLQARLRNIIATSKSILFCHLADTFH